MTAIVLRERELRELQALSSILFESHFFRDVQSQAQAAAKVIAGRELGLGPMEAMRSFHVVDGKVEMSADLLAQRVKAHEKYDYTVETINDDECSIIFWQDNGEAPLNLGTSTFTMKDRERAGIPLKSEKGYPSTWAKYPRNMLFARALSNGVAWFCPDVAGGGGRLYVEGELSGDEPEDLPYAPPGVDAGTGEIVDATIVEQASEAPVEPSSPVTSLVGVDGDGGEAGERGASEDVPAQEAPPAEPETTEPLDAPTTTESGGDPFSPMESTEPSGSVARATVKQKQRLAILAQELGMDDDARHRAAGVDSFNDLTTSAAAKLIKVWQDRVENPHDHVWVDAARSGFVVCSVEGCTTPARKRSEITTPQQQLA